jgi:hypothetical protein
LQFEGLFPRDYETDFNTKISVSVLVPVFVWENCSSIGGFPSTKKAYNQKSDNQAFERGGGRSCIKIMRLHNNAYNTDIAQYY